jgi:TPP-dependent pyruvate/acetoin dehydrogenase alpha subunit
MGGHATHDEREARTTFAAELFQYWGKRDPIGLYERWLIEGQIDLESGQRSASDDQMRDRNAEILSQIEESVIKEVDQAAEEALVSYRTRMPQPQSAAEGVYAIEESASIASKV